MKTVKTGEGEGRGYSRQGWGETMSKDLQASSHAVFDLEDISGASAFCDLSSL